MNIQEYIKSAIHGNLESYEYLVDNFQAYTINYAFSILRDYQLAEDAAQETFILLFRNIKNLNNPEAFLSWLKKITFSCCNRITRRKKLEICDDYEETYVEVNPSKQLEAEERLLMINNALERISKTQREAITLHFFMNKSYTDIAVLLGISETAVANRIYAGKKKLKEVMLTSMNDYCEEIITNKKEFTRKVLEQVPNITTQDPRVQENFQFCGCMRAVMQYLKKDPEYDFIFFAGITGALFSNVWSYQPIWDYSESTVSHVNYTGKNDIIKSAFHAVGYECEIILKEEIQKNKKYYLNKIVESLNRGLPILTYGIVGPPTCSLISGYDEEGEILIGWSAFQDGQLGMPDGYEPCGYFRKRNGLDESCGLIFFGKEIEAYTGSRIAAVAIQNIKRIVNLEKSEQYLYGTEAFKAWAEALMDDQYYNEDSALLEKYADVHCGMKVIVMTGSTYMGEFLNRLKKYDPNYSELCDQLLILSEKEDIILRKFWEIEPQFMFNAKKLREREYRTKLADIVLEAGDIYRQMVDVINNKSC